MAKTVKEQIGVDFEEPRTAQAEVIEQEQPEEPTRPEWLPEKFKDETEFAASYKNLEDELRRRGDEQRQLQTQITSLSQLVEGLQPAQQTGPGQDIVRQQLQESFENDPIGTMAYLAEQYAQQTVEARISALQQQQDPYVRAQVARDNELLAIAVDGILQQRHGDWNDYKEKVSQEIQSDPTLLSESVLHSPELTARSLERVYETLKARDILSQVEAGTFQQPNTESMKRRAQSMGGSAGRPGQMTNEEAQVAAILDAAKNMSYSSMRSGA